MYKRQEYHVNGSVFILKEGQALFGNANSLHSGNMVEGQDCHYISITFDPRLVYGYENSLIYEKYVMPVVLDGALCGVVFDGSQDWHDEMVGPVSYTHLDVYKRQSLGSFFTEQLKTM